MRRLPFAIAVAVGAGLALAGLSSEALPVLVALTAVGLVIGCPRCVRLEPPGTLLARRGMPAAILVRGLTTFAFFAVYAYIPFALVEIRGHEHGRSRVWRSRRRPSPGPAAPGSPPVSSTGSARRG